MNLPDKIAWDDTVLPFPLARANSRGGTICLGKAPEEILRQHNSPPAGGAMLAEVAKER